mgnify:CR=1 FL=1
MTELQHAAKATRPRIQPAEEGDRRPLSVSARLGRLQFHQSGKFRANNRHISKRGNRYLRKTGYEVMQSFVMHKPANDPIFTFIEKKRGEGKSGKLAMVAGLNKFLRVYYGKVTELYRSLPTIE